jgi:HlyD family secretion protein
LVEDSEGVKIGDEVEVTLRLRDEDKKYPGKITQVAPDAVDRVSKVGLSEKRIKVEISPVEGAWEGLGPYWPVEIRFITARTKNCLIAPKSALFEDTGDVWKAWVVRDGKLAALQAERGIQTPSQIEIRGDFSPGDIIVRKAKAEGMAEGKKVRAVL